MSVPFTQYMRPDGRPRDIVIDLDPDHEARAKKILAEGYRFEAEVLTTGQVSLTVADPREEYDVRIEICPNNEAVPASVAKLIDSMTALLEDWPCECGHVMSWHKHADRCRFEDCTCRCYRETARVEG